MKALATQPRSPGAGAPVLRVLRALWSMLDSRRRATFAFLCWLLMVAGVLEMGGMVAIFAYVHGLEVSPTGHRSGPLARALELAFPRELSQVEFVCLGGLAVVAFMTFKTLFGTGVRFAMNRLLMKLNQRVSERVYQAYMTAPYELFLRRGFLAPAREIGRLFGLFGSCFAATTQILADSMVLLMTWALLLWIDAALTGLASLVFAGVGFGLYTVLAKRLRRMGEAQDSADRDVNQFLNEGMEGVIEVRLRGATSYYSTSYARALARTALISRRAQAIARLPRSANEVALTTLIVGITLYITLRGESVASTLPTLGVFGFAMIRTNGVLSRVSVSAQTLKRKIGAFEKAFNRLREMVPGAVGLPDTPIVPYFQEEVPFPPGVDGRMARNLTLRNVTFGYPGMRRNVVKKVTMKIRRGEFVAICGPSGSGKSTLLLLVMGLVRPTSGEITCDDWPIFEHIQAWHRNIGYVSQSSLLVARSLRENVAFGIDPALIDDTRVWSALELASAGDFVRQLDGQLSFELKEDAANLSGGQRQRIIIARALYEDPDIVILDEATAALDNTTEREVTEAISSLRRKKTVICVAHRLSTIKTADRIYFFKDYRVAAKGTFDQLSATCPDFADMVAASDGSPRQQGSQPGSVG